MPIIQTTIVEDADLPVTMPCLVGGSSASGQAPGSSFSPTFSPLSLPNCVLWLRADMGITIGTGVSAWADQSGNGNNFTQATGTKQPVIFNPSSLNSKPALRFINASAQELDLGSVTASLSPTTGITVAAVYGVIGNEEFATIINAGTASGTAGWALYGGPSSTLGAMEFWLNTYTLHYGGGLVGLINGRSYDLIGVYNSANVSLYVNGEVAGTVSSYSNPISYTSVTNISIGSGAGTLTLEGYIPEVVVYQGGLNANQVAQLHSYFVNRYGLAI